MDVDSDDAHAVSNVDDWLTRFSPATGTFPFTSHKTQSIESRRARMSDLLIFDVLLIRGGIRSPDMFFPPADWASLRRLLDVIDQSIYDILKKDCLVYILLKWAWDMDTKETNPGWDVRYLQDRCIAPQFVALADAYWLLDTGTHLARAVSLLSDARLNRDYVSKILQALSLSSSPASFTSGTSPATATLIVKYVRTAKPLLTEPDDIDLYALSLAQLSFMDAWAYQKSFPEGGNTRERLLGKMVGWCLMPSPKQEPLAQLLAFPLSSYEQSFLYAFALPSQFSTPSSLSSVNAHITPTSSKPILSSQAMSILQDLLCVRAIQSGDYVGAIKLDRQFSSVSPPVGSGASLGAAPHTTPFGRDVIDRKSIIQDLFSTLPPAERMLLEDEIGRVATGVRVTASTSTPRQNASAPVRRPLVAELSLSASWEDVGASMSSPALSTSCSPSSSAVGASFASKGAPAPVGKVTQLPLSTSTPASPFTSRATRPSFGHQAPPTPKFTAFGSPIPPATSTSKIRGVITERTKMLSLGGPRAVGKSTAHISLFDTAGSAKNAQNAFYKPPSAPSARTPTDASSTLAGSTNAKQTTIQNGKAHRGEHDGEDVSMGSGSDVDAVEDGHYAVSGGEERGEEAATDGDDEDVGNFLTYEKSSEADLTLHAPHADEITDEDHSEPELGFSVFSGKSPLQNGSVGRHEKKDLAGSERALHASPPRFYVSPPREVDKALNVSVAPTTSRSRAPPGAFHPEEENDVHEDEGESGEDDRGGHTSQATPTRSPRRSTRARRPSETPSRPSRSQPQRSTMASGRPSTGFVKASNRPRLSHTIPGALMDEDNDEHGQDGADHTDTHGEDTEMDEQEEEEDAIAPLPSRASRRTRSSGFFDASTLESTTSSKPTAAMKATAPAAASKGKAKARPSEATTPMRRSSRLSMASSGSPDHTDAGSPTKRKSTGKGSGATTTTTTTTRSSARRKR